ncbi:unnamed protein product [Heterotrigona itama]|uniref:Uncharacterized protein n=1 Tax=Heterotrigona itama TaxID=395501 RepID=A0A6V7HIW2_9HYME|nr:unnamed protein product [Heterotrigona itama]
MFKSTAKVEKLRKHRAWILLKATDFNSLMHPCFFVCWLFGNFPYKYEPPVYSLCKSRFAFSTSMMFIYVLSLLVMVYEINVTRTSDSSITKTICVNLFYFLDGAVILTMYMLTVARLSMIQNLSKTSSMLSANDFKDLARVIHTKDILGFLFLVSHIPNCFKQNIFLTLRSFYSIYIMMANFSIDMLHMNCVCVLKACLAKIDECIQQMRKLAINDDIWTQTFIHHGSPNSLLITKLKNFEKKHLEISDIIELMNDTFMIHIIIMAISTFISVTLNLYFCILYMYKGSSENMENWIMGYLSGVAFYFLKFAMMIWACETTTNQAEKIKATLYNVFSRAFLSANNAQEKRIWSKNIRHECIVFHTGETCLNHHRNFCLLTVREMKFLRNCETDSILVDGQWNYDKRCAFASHSILDSSLENGNAANTTTTALSGTLEQLNDKYAVNLSPTTDLMDLTAMWVLFSEQTCRGFLVKEIHTTYFQSLATLSPPLTQIEQHELRKQSAASLSKFAIPLYALRKETLVTRHPLFVPDQDEAKETPSPIDNCQ